MPDPGAVAPQPSPKAITLGSACSTGAVLWFACSAHWSVVRLSRERLHVCLHQYRGLLPVVVPWSACPPRCTRFRGSPVPMCGCRSRTRLVCGRLASPLLFRGSPVQGGNVACVAVPWFACSAPVPGPWFACPGGGGYKGHTGACAQWWFRGSPVPPRSTRFRGSPVPMCGCKSRALLVRGSPGQPPTVPWFA